MVSADALGNDLCVCCLFYSGTATAERLYGLSPWHWGTGEDMEVGTTQHCGRWNEKSEPFSWSAPRSAPFLCHLSAPLVSLGGSCLRREGQAALERQRKAEKWDRMGIVWLGLSLPRGWGSVEWMRVMRNYCFKIKEIKWHRILLTELRLPSG